MRAIIRLALAASALLSIAAAPSDPPVDLTGTYTQFLHATEGLPTAERVARFRQLMAGKFPGFYDAKRTGTPEVAYDNLIAASFKEFPAIEPAFTARAKSLAPQLADAQRDFKLTFADAGRLPPVYLVHSLGEMDGGTLEIAGRSVLVFGADVIAKVHAPGSNERPFFEHEIFHTYHEPRLGNCEEFWCSLWEEGLAVYVSSRLNPGASDDELLVPTALRRGVEARRSEAVCALRARVASIKESDRAPFFFGGHKLPGLPERSGYYLGLLLAQRLGRDASLTALANWNAAVARPKVLAALAEMAPTCATRG